jgi:hypothetical protein
MRRPVIRKLFDMIACTALTALLVTCGGGSSSGSSSAPPSQDYVVFAWNDLGMHCLNPTYDQAVILPPYNTVWAQVVKRGNPPQVVTDGLRVDYRLIDNTYSYGKGSYGQFWDNVLALFGVANLPHDMGLNLEDPTISNGLAGTMVAKTDHFQVNGIPLTPINDSNLNAKNPYQVAEISVMNAAGALVAQTRATVPTSDEINCGKCHGPDPLDPTKAMQDVIQKHNTEVTSVTLTAPVLCASCHGSPALGMPTKAPATTYLSQAIHGFHGNLANVPACYDCHPGGTAKCNRSLRHTTPDGNCTACHGTMAQVASTITSGARIPWAMEPTCASCHNSGSTIPQVDTGAVLYRNAKGHGGVSCAACHGSPHAMVPSSQPSDNYQARQYMSQLPGANPNTETSMGSCGACHNSSKPHSLNGWIEEHRSEHTSACNVCHTGFTDPGSSSKWPHNFQWKDR